LRRRRRIGKVINREGTYCLERRKADTYRGGGNNNCLSNYASNVRGDGPRPGDLGSLGERGWREQNTAEQIRTEMDAGTLFNRRKCWGEQLKALGLKRPASFLKTHRAVGPLLRNISLWTGPATGEKPQKRQTVLQQKSIFDDNWVVERRTL